MKYPKKKRIILKPRCRKALEAELGISKVAVFEALNYNRNHEGAQKVRELAFTRYEGVVEEVTKRSMKEEDILY